MEKRRILRRLLSSICALVLLLGIPCVVGAVDRHDDMQKTAVYEAYLDIIAVKSKQYDIGFIPLSFDRFNLDEGQLKRFEDMWDCIGALQAEMRQERAGRLPYIDDTLKWDGQTKGRALRTDAGAVRSVIRVSGSFYTELDSDRAVQVFSAATPRPTAKIVMPKGYKWIETANSSGVSSENGQQYIVVIQGDITGIGIGTFTGVDISEVFFCNDYGLVF